MPSTSTVIPRIDRAVPHGPITRPAEPPPVWALIIWRVGGGLEEQQVPAIAVAWTRAAVRIVWESKTFGLREDWVPAAYVWRTYAERPANPRWAPLRARG